MKAKFVLPLVLLLASIAHAKTGQAVPLNEAPEMSQLPWVVLFTADDWQNDPKSVQVKGWLDSAPEFADLTLRARYHHFTASNPKAAGYAKYHANSFPAVLVMAPDPQSDADIWACVRLAGMPDSAGELSSLMPLDENELRGRLFNRNAAPYWLPRNRPYNQPNEPAPEPAPSVTPPPSPARPFIDTGLLSKVNANGERLAKLAGVVEKAIELNNSPKGKALSGLLVTLIGLISGGGGGAFVLKKLLDADD